MATYSAENHCFLTGEEDRFRNPVGHIMRENLALLLGELFGAMDAGRTRAALASIVRIRTVQNLHDTETDGFLALLRGIVTEKLPLADLAGINLKIDALFLQVSEESARCREYLDSIRENERLRAMAVLAMLQARGR